MANYKNFFSADSPLNLFREKPSFLESSYNISNRNKSNANSILSLMPFYNPSFTDNNLTEEDLEQQRLKEELLREQQRLQEELLRQLQEEQRRLEKERRQQELLRLNESLMSEYNKKAQIQLLLREHPEDLLLYDSKTNSVIPMREFNEYTKLRQALMDEYKKEFNTSSEGLLIISSLLNTDDFNKAFEEESESHKEFVKNHLDTDEETFNKAWNSATQADKLDVVLRIIEETELSDEEKEGLYSQLSNEDKLGYLAGKLKSNPFYQTFEKKGEARRQEAIDEMHNEFALTLPLPFPFLLSVGPFSLNLADQILAAIGKGTHPLVTALPRGLLSMRRDIESKLANWGWGLFDGAFKDADNDEFINNLENNFVQKLGEQQYQQLKQYKELDPQKYDAILQDFDKLSQSSSDYMSEWLGNKEKFDKTANGIYAISDDDKIRQYANYIVRENLYGQGSGVKGVADFWLNHIDEVEDTTVEGFTDKYLKTYGTFWTTAIADMASFAGVVYSLKDPLNYSEDLVTDNALVRWATDVQATGCLDPEYQEKYKLYNANALKIHKSVEEENSPVTGDDVFDVVGQYGFTAATTALSLGGSAAVKGLSVGAKGMAKAAIKAGIKPYTKKAIRGLIQEGLASSTAMAEKRLAVEAIWKALQNTLRWGNIAFSGGIGTAEGALEAQSTYDTFIKDNSQDDKFNQLVEIVNNAEGEELIALMEQFGLPHNGITVNPETGQLLSFYTEDDLKTAKELLITLIEDARNAANTKVLEEAVRAATSNFLVNSAINGMLQVTLKEAVLSKDAREAIRLSKGNQILDLLDIKQTAGKWHAAVKEAITNTNKTNIFKASHWKNIGKLSKEAAKNSGGEFLEEYSQNISDEVSRDIFLQDLDNYLKIVFNPEAREAFETDASSLVETGLKSIGTETTDIENIKAGIIGFASSSLGGFSPVKAINKVVNFKNRGDEYKGKAGTARYIFETLWDNAYSQAYQEESEKYHAAELLAEEVNDWFANEESQALVNHMGGAIGFAKAMQDGILAEDINSTKDNKLGLIIETATMLKALENTEYGKAMLQKLDERAKFDTLYSDDDFNDSGEYTGDNAAVSDAIAEFRAHGTNLERSTSMTDKAIVEKIQSNAKEFLALYKEVDANTKRLNSIFNTDAIAPAVLKALVYGFVVLKNLLDRLPKLTAKINKATESLSEEDKKELKKSGLSNTAIDLISEYGSLDGALKELKAIEAEIAKQTSIRDYHQDKRTSRPLYTEQLKKLAKARIRQLNKLKKDLSTKVAKFETELKEAKMAEVEDITSEIPADRFTAGDIANMSIVLRSEVIANKENYSKEQQEEIDKYISIMQRGMQTSEGDVLITTRDIELDLIDEGVMTTKLQSYNKYLNEYASNARFLNTRAAELYQLDRKRVLRSKYKKDLEVQEGESPMQYISRLEAKTQVLKDLGKILDAEIFLQLVRENPIAKRVEELKGDIGRLNFTYQLSKKISAEDYKAAEDEDAVNINAALQTLMLNGNKNLKELQEIFDTNDIEELEKLLKATDTTGESFFNKYRREAIETLQASAVEGEKTIENKDIDLSDLKLLDGIINLIKTLLDLFKNPELAESPKTTGNKIVPDTRGAGSKATLDNKGTQAASKGSQAAVSTLEIILVKTPGDLDNIKQKGLRDFLESKSASLNLENTSNGSKGLDGKVKFAITKEYKGEDNTKENPVIFVLSPDGKKVLGVVDSTSMPEIQEIASVAYSNISDENKMHILEIGTKGNTAEVQTLNSGKLVHDNFIQDARLDSLGKEKTPEAITKEATLIILTSTIKEILKEPEDPKLGKTKVITYGNAYVKKDNRYLNAGSSDQEGYLTIWTYPITINGTQYSLEDLLIGTGNFTEADIITALKEDDFFGTLFKKWGSYTPAQSAKSDTEKATDAFYLLIDDFIYIGKVKNPTISPDLGRLILTFEGKNSEISILIPEEGELDTSTIDKMALSMLLTIYKESNQIKEGETSANLLFSIPNISIRALEAAEAYPSLKNDIHLLEARKLAGLIKAGYISTAGLGYYAADFKIKNPFYKSSARKTITTDPNASIPDNGGVTPKEGSKKTPKLKIALGIQNALDRAKEIVKDIIDNSKQITLDNPNASTYSKGGRKLFRVTTLDIGLRSLKEEGLKKFEGSSNIAAVSSAYGNVGDAIGREFFDYFYEKSDDNYPKKIEEAVEYIAPIIAGRLKFTNSDSEPKYTEDSIPNLNSDLYKAVIRQFVILKSALDADGWHVASKNLLIDGTTKVFEGGVCKGTIPVGGALDLIAYNDNGDFIIIDMKTIKWGGKGVEEPEVPINYRKGKWRAQTNSYGGVLEQRYSDMNIIGKYIFPIFLQYNDPGEVVPEFEADGITFKKRTSVVVQLTGSPTSLGELNKDATDANSLEKCLVKIKDAEFDGVDIESILEGESEETQKEFRDAIMPLPADDAIVTGGEKPNTVAPSEEPHKKLTQNAQMRKRLGRKSSGNSKKSQRTQKQARFTEFVNNHIAPIKEIKLGVVAKTITKIGKWFTKKENLDSVIKRDLANAFFGGDLSHAETVLKDVDVNDIPQVIAAISDYYNAYVSKRELYLDNIGRRQRLNAALHDFFSGNISRNQLDRLLDNIGLKAREVPILLEYLDSNNRPLAAKNALAKLEAKKEYTKEYAQVRTKEMTAMMDNMQTKLEFLQDSKAERMLGERIESVKQAVLSGSLRETKVSKTAPSLMSIEKGTYGATSLLRNIIRHSDNANFKHLARTLLSYILENSMVVNVSIGDSLIDLVEGEAAGRTISISKDSMDTFEHFERVFLHEVLHTVVKLSPELRDTLEDLRKLAIFSIVQQSNLTELEVIDLIYGLTNVDEFITEFFTNYAFQDTLKQLTEEKYDNIFDSIVGKVKNYFTKDKSLYGKITDSMNTVMESIDIESIKKEEVEIASGDYDSFDRLSEELQKAIKARGFSAATYNALNFLARELLKRCCI